MAVLRVAVPSDWIAAFTGRLAATGLDNGQSVCNTLYAAALLGESEVLSELLFGSHRKEHMLAVTEHKHQFYLARQYLLLLEQREELSGPLDMSSNTLTRWHQEFRARPFSMYSLQQDVGSYLPNSFRAGAYIPEIGSKVTYYDAKSKMVLQVDGPSHFLSDGSYDGSSAFQSRLLEACGYRVVRISYSVWNHLATKRKKAEYVQSFLK
jgi:very-short-patch-repair endonuclease